MDVCTTYAELESRVKALPPPKPGYVRVYRGQVRNAPLIPSSQRTTSPIIPQNVVRYAHLIAYDATRNRPEESMNAVGLRSYPWAYAVVQHYSYPSPVLDVSTSLEVAVWFALNEAIVQIGQVTFDGLPFTAQRVIYEPWTGFGYIYVLDVIRKTNGGSLIELSSDPPPYYISERMRRQSGAVLLGTTQQSLVIEQPISVHGPFADTPHPARGADWYFPQPSEDAWYRRLITVPASLSLSSSTPSLIQSLPITIYGDWRRVVPSIRRLLPTPIYPDMVRKDLSKPIVNTEVMRGYLAHATLIVADTCHLFMMPQIGVTSLWDEERLAMDIDPSIQVQNATVTVSTSNVFFEFSPLEGHDWDRATARYLRALWVVRHSHRIAYTRFEVSAQTGELYVIGPYEAIYDNGPHRFKYPMRDGSNRFLSDDPHLAKPVFTLLELLRQLANGSRYTAAAHPSQRQVSLLWLGPTVSGYPIYRMT